MSGLEKDKFTIACENAIASNQLVICAVTSNTQASFESDGIPFGAGKSTLALELSYRFNHFDPETRRYYDVGLDRNDERNWETVKKHSYYYPSKLLKAVHKAEDEKVLIQCALWDDVQYTAPARAGTSPALEELVGDLTTERPTIRILILTCPNILGISSIVRSIVQFEIIVYARGRFEVQRVMYRKNFRNPRKDLMRLDYVSGEDPTEKEETDFDALPSSMQTWYDNWRKDEKRPKRAKTIATLERYEKVVPQDPTLAPRSEAARELAFRRWGHREPQQ